MSRQGDDGSETVDLQNCACVGTLLRRSHCTGLAYSPTGAYYKFKGSKYNLKGDVP